MDQFKFSQRLMSNLPCLPVVNYYHDSQKNSVPSMFDYIYSAKA